MRILVIEDEPNAREGLCTLLTEEGFSVFEAADGQEGLEKLLAIQPDAVLCDLSLPKLDGISVLRQARQLGVRARFILMTGMMKKQPERGSEAMESGANGYLLKPLNLDALLQLVTGLTGPEAETAVVGSPA